MAAVLDGDGVVRAAGGVVVRPGADGTPEVVLIHRPAPHEDWSFPKGHVDPGETDEVAALREVAEETGLDAVLGVELPATRYTDRHGRPKCVRYWLMELDPARPGVRPPDDEVDEVRWFPLAMAHDVLSYDLDRSVLAAVIPSVRSSFTSCSSPLGAADTGGS